jgi:hypothetical protein
VVLDDHRVRYRRVSYPFDITARKIYAIDGLDAFLGDRLQKGQ